MGWGTSGSGMPMSRRKFVWDTVILIVWAVIAAAFGILVYYCITLEELKLLCYLFLGVCLVMSCLLYLVFRKMFLKYSSTVCDYVDALTAGKIPEVSADEDTLTSKIEMKLDKLSEVTYSTLSHNQHQKEEIQQMVSDISHQLKTPISNITMYSSMLEDGELPPEQMKQFLAVINAQVGKLEFLVNALTKMSRLENHLISLDIQPCRIFDTIFQAVSQVSVSAEKKNIRLQVSCDEHLMLPHDPKWTAEAIFNILDNAVKYTGEGGQVTITVEPWEIFTKIDIRDSGIGISEEHINDIFQRFYREGKVHKIEGVGIGLYLSRHIITQQGGYIKVKSQEGAGSVFSVFLQNDVQVQ